MRLLRSIARAVLYVLAGILLNAFASQATTLLPQAALLVASTIVFVAAFPRYIGIGLTLSAVFTLSCPGVAPSATHQQVEPYGLFHVAYLVQGTVGLFLLGSPRGFRVDGPAPGIGCLLASLPAWSMATAHPELEWLALALVFVGLGLASLRPVLSGTRQRRGPRADPIAAPLVEVVARSYAFDRGAGLLKLVAGLAGLAAAIGGVMVGLAFRHPTPTPNPAATPVVGLMLLTTGGILCVTLLGCLWLNRRLGFRVDALGLHANRVVDEFTVRWTDVVALECSSVRMRYGVSFQYWDVCGTNGEIKFPDSLSGSAELRATVEAATGLRWP